MSDRIAGLAATASTQLNASALAATRAAAVPQQPIFVDVSDRPVRSNIVREGFQVPAAQIDPSRLGSFIDQWTPIPPRESPRVVRQSVPAGTKVQAGTAVDLVLAPRSIIPLDVFTNVHEDLRQRTVEQVSSVFQNPDVLRTVLRTSDPRELSQAERERVVNVASQQLDIAIDDAQPERSFDRVFGTLRNAAAFR